MRSPTRLRRRSVTLTVSGLAVAALGLTPLPAQADFTLPRCGGTDIQGRGGSFQTAAQTLFTQQFNVATPNGCGGTPTIGTYDGAGSGAGRQAFGEKSATDNPNQLRSTQFRYAAADEAPNPTQRAQIEKGPIDNNGADVTAADDGKLHVIPVAVGATTVDVNYPDGCTLPDASSTNPGNGPGAGDQTGRLKISADDIEAVFGNAKTTWGALVPTISETAAGGRAAGACAALPIYRIVRFDDSGTTFSLKAWLNTVNGARGWTGSELGATPNTKWPTAGGNVPPAVVSAAGAACTDASHLCSNTSKGGGALLDVLKATDGSIGYADIKTARSKNLDLNPSTAPAAPDTTYWIPVQNKNATLAPYTEPTTVADAYKVNGVPGANCADATFANLPSDTLGNFSPVNAAASTKGYPLCVLTYMLAWDDYAAVYGNTDVEQGKARTAKDYLDRILTDSVQALEVSYEYQSLPPAILALSRAGAAKVGWNKGATGTTPVDNTPVVTTTPAPSGSATAVPTTVAKTPPSNVFSVDSARVSKTGVISLTLRLPGAGAVAVSATGPKKLKVGSATGTAKAAGNLKVTISPSSKTKKALKKTKKLKVSLGIAFTPTGGSVATQAKTLTLKGKVVKKKHKKGSKKK